MENVVKTNALQNAPASPGQLERFVIPPQ